MRIARFVHPGSTQAEAGVAWGVVEGTEPAATGPDGDSRSGLTVAAIDGHPFGPIRFTGDRWALADVRLLSPILPSKVVAVGKNYADHAREMGGEPPTVPMLFLKPSTSVIGDGDVIRIPADAGIVHHEVELAVVIGKPARDVGVDEAMSHILGYTIANDVSSRTQQASDTQWTRAKGHDSFCPLGPWIETVLDPADLALQCWVNGEVRQDARTSDLIHNVAALLSFMSGVMTLLPGDVLITGTPAGVGPLVDGDTVTMRIEGIGTLTNSVRTK